MIVVDENALGNIIGQLVDNAVTFIPAGGEVRISAARDGGCVQIVVADNGPGVSPEDVQRILEPFEQAARGIHDHAQGAGLGLPLAKALAELHGGALSIASRRGQGFTATVGLPTG
jgi:signal transduction histidine kinase